jgi:hypothetical protein
LVCDHGIELDGRKFGRHFRQQQVFLLEKMDFLGRVSQPELCVFGWSFTAKDNNGKEEDNFREVFHRKKKEP